MMLNIISQWLNKKAIPYILVFVGTVALVTLFDCSYETPDDLYMLQIASGCFTGSPCPYLIWINYLYGSFLASLYSCYPVIEWYTWLYILWGLISVNIFLWYIQKLDIEQLLKYLFMLMIAIIYFYSVLNLQFTFIAAELSLASALLILKKGTVVRYLLSFFLFAMAVMIRAESAFIPYALLFPLMVFPLEWKKRSYQGKLLFLLLLFLTASALSWINRNSYPQNDQWKNYFSYNAGRGYIQDNPSAPKFRNLITGRDKKEEYDMLTDAHENDGTIMNADDLNKCVAYLQTQRIENIRQNIIPFMGKFKYQGSILLVLFIYIFVGFLRQRKYVSLFLLTSSFSLFIIALLYIMTRNFPKDRVFLSMMIPLFFMVFSLVNRNHKRKENIVLYLSVLVMTLFYSVHTLKRYGEMRAEMIRNSEVERMLSQTSSDKVVFMKIPYAMDAFHISDKVIAKKMIRVAWTLNAPIVKPYFNGYTSLVNGYPILIEKKSKVNKIQIIRDLLLSYYHCPTKLIVESETADLEMVRIIKID